MSKFTLVDYSWLQFLIYTLLIIGGYLLLVFLANLFARNVFSGIIPKWLINLIRKMKILYEPIAFLVILVLLVFVNPEIYVFIVALFFILTFTALRNYLLGRLLILDSDIEKGKQISFSSKEGTIQSIDRLGLKVQTEAGLHFINYKSLIEDGYILITGKEVSKIYQLLLTTDETGDRALLLNDFLLTTPYIDWGSTPEIELDEKEDTLRLKVLLTDKRYLKEFVALLRDRGYHVTL